MKNRDVIITVVVVVLIGWLIIRHYTGSEKKEMQPTPPAKTTEKTMQP